MDRELTHVGVFVEKQWEYDYYIRFFTEMVERAGKIQKQVVTKDFCNISSDLYAVRIYLGAPMQRGYKFDIVFDTLTNREVRNEMIIPTLNSSKFSDWHTKVRANENL